MVNINKNLLKLLFLSGISHGVFYTGIPWR